MFTRFGSRESVIEIDAIIFSSMLDEHAEQLFRRCGAFDSYSLLKKIQLDLMNSRARLNAILQLISCVILLVRNGNVCEVFFSAIYIDSNSGNFF